MKLFEGFKNVFMCKEAFTRHISLFSLCGIAGLLNVYLLTGKHSPIFSALAIALLIIFEFYFTGYEILFLKERCLPDIDMRSFKIVLNILPFGIFAANIIFLALSFLPDKYNIIFISTILVSLPLVILMAGYSYNFNNEEALCFLKKYNLRDYAVLFLRKIVLITVTCLIVMTVLSLVVICLFLILLMLNKNETREFVLSLLSHYDAYVKLAAYGVGVAISYASYCTFLIWDYQLITMKEN